MNTATKHTEHPSWFSRIDTSRCQEHFDEVEAFALKNDRHEQLMGRLAYLCQGDREEDDMCYWGRPMRDFRLTLFRDFAPYSFEFLLECQPKDSEDWVRAFNGGIIFHGPHDNGGDGGAPTFSVNLTPQDGWSIHT